MGKETGNLTTRTVVAYNVGQRKIQVDLRGDTVNKATCKPVYGRHGTTTIDCRDRVRIGGRFSGACLGHPRLKDKDTINTVLAFRKGKKNEDM